ncbi:MAG: RluA family pseudouridine synthase [Oscillospiraceae bacterium]|nr:RluA family pseudouridine synthase [Oscillospiraceae bacterium]
MREFRIGKNDAGQRLDRFLGKAIPLLPASLAQKYIRLKRIKCNGVRASREQKLCEGDLLQCYINDEFFETPSEENVYLTITTPKLRIVYEDDNIMLLDKPVGQVVHADEGEKVNTLVNHMLAYLYQKREWNPRKENAFTPALCNRIDRNTGGIVIAAKNAEALRILNDKIRDREIAKYYLCIALGSLQPPGGRIECFLRKDAQSNTVRVYHHPVPEGRSAVTLYKTLRTNGALSLLEVELLTGRTHQIRASFADLGHPLLGDGKYGSGAVNRKYGETHQALYSYRLRFDFPTDAGALSYLRGKEFMVGEVPFQKKYFPGSVLTGTE